MDRIWQWAWDRHGARYTLITSVIAYALCVAIYLCPALAVVAYEDSRRYIDAAVAVVVAAAPMVAITVLPGHRQFRLAERFAAGADVDRTRALAATYAYSRGLTVRWLWATGPLVALLLAGVGAIAGASPMRLLQYGVVGLCIGTAVQLIAIRSVVEAAMRPVRTSLAGGADVGDALPRSSPTFADWSNASMIATAFGYAVFGAMLASVVPRTDEVPLMWVVIAAAATLVYAVPVSVGLGFSRSLQPVRDLTAGAEHVAAGDYSRRLPVVQDDDLGVLSASFNRMQAGLAERQRLQAAFGTYVDPGLAERLLRQGDDVFTGERREVTVMFVDIRDFTPFAEANVAEDVVTRLNALFEIVVPAVVGEGGHVNKFLGDGALAVFGAPNDLENHADAAVAAAQRILGEVNQRFGDALRIGIGINTGKVIAGTIGGAGKLEFTLIGDAVNVAARVEQLTKTTGDAILLTQQTVDGMAGTTGLVDRGLHAVKGKSTAVQVYGLDPQ